MRNCLWFARELATYVQVLSAMKMELGSVVIEGLLFSMIVDE